MKTVLPRGPPEPGEILPSLQKRNWIREEETWEWEEEAYCWVAGFWQCSWEHWDMARSSRNTCLYWHLHDWWWWVSEQRPHDAEQQKVWLMGGLRGYWWSPGISQHPCWLSHWVQMRLGLRAYFSILHSFLEWQIKKKTHNCCPFILDNLHLLPCMWKLTFFLTCSMNCRKRALSYWGP